MKYKVGDMITDSSDKAIGFIADKMPVIKNSVVVNIADMFQRWTNDRYVSTPHRVMNVLDRTRYSMPYFVGPNKDTIVKNLTDEPDKYDPISSYEYLLWRLGQSY